MQLSRALILFFSLISLGASATNFADDPDLLKISEQGKNPVYSEPIEIPHNIHQEEAINQAQVLVKSMQSPMENDLKVRPKDLPTRTIIFLSLSLGPKALEDFMLQASLEQNSILVFRGVKDTKNIAKALLEIQKVAAKFDPVPHIVIDPTLFRKYSVSRVPTIIFMNEKRTKELSRVAGMYDTKWLIDSTNAGDVGDRGVKGPTFDITEPDLTEVMKAKVAEIDWAEKKENAVKRYWDKQVFLPLPAATSPRVKYVDPTILVTSDIKDAGGKTIVPKGAEINPLKLHTFNQAVIVFNPMNPQEVKAVDAKLKILKEKYPRITLIATSFDRKAGWDGYKKTTDHFAAPVFKLTPDVKSRFELENTPSLVTSSDFKFRVEEFVE